MLHFMKIKKTLVIPQLVEKWKGLTLKPWLHRRLRKSTVCGGIMKPDVG